MSIDAYYYCFNAMGVEIIDRILDAVALAGRESVHYFVVTRRRGKVKCENCKRLSVEEQPVVCEATEHRRLLMEAIMAIGFRGGVQEAHAMKFPRNPNFCMQKRNRSRKVRNSQGSLIEWLVSASAPFW